MSCEQEAKLDRFVDSELSDSESAELRTHLVTCAECAAGALSRLQLRRMTQATGGRRFRPSPEFRLKVERSIGVAQDSTWARRWTRRWAPAFAAAAALALLLLSATVWWQHSRNADEALGELADLHVATLASANPVDVVSTDRHTVKPWFQGKLPFTFNLPELRDSPFKLLGGRVAYFQQSPGAQLLFEIGRHQISVFIFQNRGEASRLNSGSSVSRELTFGSETWTEGGLRYFVIGDAGRANLHNLSELLKGAARS